MAQDAPALFLADTLGLDFLNSVATDVDTPIDWIEDGDGLLAWLEQAELVSPETLASLRERALPGEFDSVAAQARGLREEFRAFVREHRGTPLGAADVAELASLNRLLARDEGFLQLAVAEGVGATGLELRTVRRWRSPESLLLPIGEALARFLSEEDFSYVKACEGPACTLMFVDHTRGRARRWCSMALCGNRAKQAAHRDRVRKSRDLA
ncbi:CGNR zinc finger domain-containing protein [Streptomyces sp. NPDC058665]|uniref:CGNR zinc finger domain-containing protein n=1 Tax=Streptomyces sp. NPDC058665 TaxID=3346586 RepID=UPI0036484E2E